MSNLFLAYYIPGDPRVSTTKFNPFGPAVWPAIRNIYINKCVVFLYRLADESGVTRVNNIFFNLREKNFKFFFSLLHPRPPKSVHNKIQPIRSGRLAGYRQHIFIRMSYFIIKKKGVKTFLICYCVKMWMVQ